MEKIKKQIYEITIFYYKNMFNKWKNKWSWVRDIV